MVKTSWVATLMRVVLGILLLAHGISKFQMGLGNVAAWFASAGTPGFLAYIAGWLELIGGILLILGLFTRYVSMLFTVMLLGAIVMMKLPLGLLGNGQMAGYELDLAYLMLTIYFIFAGPGSFSIDKVLFGKGKAAA
ncbi:DoxX family protein [Paenibacillus andongensis]|uniref:DoxX family protein n=1 Tax=Paenibacillus andongensis TaxID=2975482 RepID=UPI0021BB4D00|nr:DoxX family protein [Paenibacillus andongensis]